MGEQNLKELQKAYALLQETNEKLYSTMKAFQIAAEESGSLVFTYDIKKQTIFVDERTAQSFKVDTVQTGVPHEMVKLGIVSEDTKSEYIRIHEAVMKGAKEAKGIVKLIPVGGTETVFELNLRSIFDKSGKATGTAVGVYRNITERYIKDMEQERYQKMLYQSDRFNFEYDIDHDILNIICSSEDGGKNTYSYAGYRKMLNEKGLCPESDIPIMRDFLERGAEQPIQVRLYNWKTEELRWYGLSGIVLKNEGRPCAVKGSITDITELKEREVAQRKLERVLNSLKDEYLGIIELDIEQDTYTVLTLNRELFGAEFPERGCYSRMNDWLAREIAAPDYQDFFQNAGSIHNLRETLSKERRIELEYMIKSGTYKWRKNIYQAVEYNKGIPSKVIMYHLDIDQFQTEKLKQQEAMREAYNYAESANTAKTEFLSRMSHDIRTPMNAIIGMTAIAGTYIDNHERVRECLNKITVASKHLLSLINEVLDMSKIESGKVELQEEEFNIADLIDNMITMVLPQMNQHGHNLQVSLGELSHEWVIGDSLRIQQVFVNLITNAVKYTPDGGNINVHITEKAMGRSGYGEYEFIFEDNGIGMTEEFQAVLFEPFTRAQDSRIGQVTGTGLGMTITRNIIRMMGGDIQVVSRINEGSRFTVTIHLKLQEQRREKIEELIDLPVLVVDDDEITCESACIILEDIGMKGEWCLSGREAVEKVSRRHHRGEDYFAVILDWQMPEMNGLQAAREIRRTVGADVPIIIISAYDWSDIEEEARDAGVDKFIAKPLFKSRLIRSFKEFLHIEEEQEEVDSVFGGGADFTGKRVLLVEDNEVNAEIAGEILKISGVQVEWAVNGREAVDKVGGSVEGYYDLIFMDIQMPVLNGYEAAAAIRGLSRTDVKDMPIVAMTADAFVEDVNQAMNAGMNAHISKPIDFGRLEQILNKYLGSRQ